MNQGKIFVDGGNAFTSFERTKGISVNPNGKGINAVDGVNTRIMDSTSWSGMVGVQAEKGNFALGLNYGIQASSHETDQNVNVGFSWKF